MTRLEAEKFLEELQKLCATYQKMTSSRIDYSIEKDYEGGDLKWIKIIGISLLIQKKGAVH
jgi:hypothetical protein